MTIRIAIQYAGRKMIIETYAGEYRNLMMLLCDRLCLDDFGECGGMGRCGTCKVRLQTALPIVEGMARNEFSTLSRQGIHNPFIRLSCQLFIDSTLDGAVIIVLEDG